MSTTKSAFSKNVTFSSNLAEVLGTTDPMPRSEITKRLWDYIKTNNLQDTTNKRMINADANLLPIFGGRAQVSMFEMTSLVSKHIGGTVPAVE